MTDRKKRSFPPMPGMGRGSDEEGFLGFTREQFSSLKEHCRHQKERCPEGVVNCTAQGRQQRRAFKVLSIDGGGIRGLVALQMLAELEEEMGQPAAKMFDLMIGTSTGGIIVSALNIPNPDKPDEPLYSARDIIRYYEENGPEIFKKPFFKRVLGTVGQLFRAPQYDNKVLRQTLEHFLGKTTMQEGLTNAQITTYEIERARPFYFRNRLNPMLRGRDYNFTNADVCMATSATPTYFPGVEIFSRKTVEGQDRPTTRFATVDGGVYVNNPALIGSLEARKMIAGRDMDLVVISLGTGDASTATPLEDYNKSGIIGVARKFVNWSLGGQSQQADKQLSDLRDLLGEDYMRFDARLPTNISPDMDDASKENLRALNAFGKQLAERARRDGRFDKLVDFLKNDLKLGPIDHSGRRVTSTAFADPAKLAKYRETRDFYGSFGQLPPPPGAGSSRKKPAASQTRPTQRRGKKPASDQTAEMKTKRKPRKPADPAPKPRI